MIGDKETFLTLLRLGIGHEMSPVPECIDWPAMKALAEQHGLSAIVMDAASALNDRGLLVDGCEMDSMFKKVWIGEVIQGYENRYADYRKRIGQLAHFYNAHGFRMMVLKGYGLSLNYPYPSHRPVGDIDIWNFGEYKDADAAIHSKFGIEIDRSHHHHTVFSFMGYSVENHYDWVNVHAHKSSAEIEKIFKELAMDDSNYTEIDGQRIYLPSANLHALFLLRHSMSHFAAANINFRQLLDWAFFVEKNTGRIDWDWLVETLKHFHMYDFFVCINYICAFSLGFNVQIFPPIVLPVTEGLAEQSLPMQILDDILSPEYTAAEPKGFIRSMRYKYSRWQANAWKQRLCYPESRVDTFFTGLWAHLLKASPL